MNQAVQSVISLASGLLAKASPFAKAVVPSVAGLVGALANWAISGSFDATSIATLVGGVVVAVITYFVPNVTPAPPAPVAPAAPQAVKLPVTPPPIPTPIPPPIPKAATPKAPTKAPAKAPAKPKPAAKPQQKKAS